MKVDRIFGGIVCFLALLFLTLAIPSIPDDWQKTAGSEYFTVGPELFPFIAGGIILLMGILVVLHPTDSHKLERLRDPAARRRVLLALALSFGYASLLDFLGFTLTSILALFLFFVIFGERRWRIVIPMAVLVPIVTKFVFLKFFILELPPGIFENLPI
jgi:putative tricarboxylic transport membrane protein